MMSPISKTSDMAGKIEEAAKTSPYILIANSLEELAEKTGIRLAGLKATINEYSYMCERGRDPIFHKNERYLRPLKGPRYYGGILYPAAYGSLGGIKINYKMEVVTQDQEPIPGLYAAGVDATAIYADSYVFVLPGNTMGFALNGGRMAGENAAAYVKSINAKK